MAKKKTSISTEALVLPCDHADLAEFVRHIGELQRRRAAIAADADERIGKIATAAATETAPVAAEIAQKVAAVHAYCAAHRVPLTRHGATKTIKLATGEVSWRAQPPSVSLGRAKVATVVSAIKGMGAKFKQFIRVREELDKEAMLADAALAGTVPGVRIVTGIERFYVTPIGLNLDEVAP